MSLGCNEILAPGIQAMTANQETRDCERTVFQSPVDGCCQRLHVLAVVENLYRQQLVVRMHSIEGLLHFESAQRKA